MRVRSLLLHACADLRIRVVGRPRLLCLVGSGRLLRRLDRRDGCVGAPIAHRVSGRETDAEQDRDQDQDRERAVHSVTPASRSPSRITSSVQ